MRNGVTLSVAILAAVMGVTSAANALDAEALASLENAAILPRTGDIFGGKLTETTLDIQKMDIDQDGLQDLLIMHAFHEIGWYVQILINQGNATFVDETATRLPDQGGLNEGAENFMRLKDVNLDGALDIMIPSPLPRIFINDGAGNFQRAIFDQAPEANPGTPYIDLDGDGGVDMLLVGGDSDSLVEVLPQINGATTAEVPHDLSGLYDSSRIVVFDSPAQTLAGVNRVMDLNNDGLEDILFARFICCPVFDQAVPIQILLNNGDRTFRDGTNEVIQGPVPENIGPREIIVADFNGDGVPDVFFADQGLDAAPALGHPNSLLLSTDGGRYRDASSGLPQDAGFTHSATFGDVDGDGDLDIFVGNIGGGGPEDEPAIWLNDGAGTFLKSDARFPSAMLSSQVMYTTSLFLDVDRDGDPDLILGEIEATEEDRNSLILFNDGEGHFDSTAHLPANDVVLNFGGPLGVWAYLNDATFEKINAGDPNRIIVADVDGSGIDDVIADFGAGLGLFIRRNNGDWEAYNVNTTTHLAAADLDNNGKLDILADFGDGVGIWVRMNDATWSQFNVNTSGGIISGDMDGNGQTDVIVNLGVNGTWGKMNNATWVKHNVNVSDRMLLADLDGGGMDELIMDLGAPGIWAKRNNATWEKINANTSEGLAAGDIDGDGKDDLIVDMGAVNGLWARILDGAWKKLNVNSPNAMAFVDFDGNGKMDLILDLGPGVGTWSYRNDATWVKINANPASIIAGGQLDGQ